LDLARAATMLCDPIFWELIFPPSASQLDILGLSLKFYILSVSISDNITLRISERYTVMDEFY